MYLDRNEEFIKLMNIINKLKEMIQFIKKDFKHEYFESSEYIRLIEYIENEVEKNEESIKQIKEPFLLFIVGGGNYGKSTLINTLLKEKLVKTTDLPNTWKIDLFIKSEKEKIEITYEDNKKDVKSIKEGNRILKLEEDKYKQSKRQISKILNEYKNLNKSNIEDLKEYKQKLDKKYLYKSDISQIKHYINKGNILDDFIIVDTPGLNQTLLKNTLIRIKSYYKKADGVICLIDAQNIASRENNFMIKEIEEIDSLHKYKKNIIAVVNKIDIVRNNNYSNLEKITEKTKEIYKDMFDDIVFISAKEALEGFVTSDKSLIEKSNINYLHESIDKNFKYVALKNQINSKYKNLYTMRDSILEKIYNYKRNLYKDISIYNESKFYQQEEINNFKSYINTKIQVLEDVNYKTNHDTQNLGVVIEELQNICNITLEKIYINTYKESNFKPDKLITDINTNVYFKKSKHMVIDYNIDKQYNNYKGITNIIDVILNKNNSKLKSNEEILQSNITTYKVKYLVKEINSTINDKLRLIEDTLDEAREISFREKHIDYLDVKKYIDYLNNIENIMKTLG